MATVDIVEPLGSEKHIHVTTGKSNFVVKTSPYNMASPGQNIELVFDIEKLHIFDKDTEETII
jgi:multiple sugar transport system ATP-binding protein